MKKINAEYIAAPDTAIPDDDEICVAVDEWSQAVGLELSQRQFDSLVRVVRIESDKQATEKNLDFVRQFASLCEKDLSGIVILKALRMDSRSYADIAKDFGVSKQNVHKRVLRLRQMFRLPTESTDGEFIPDEVDDIANQCDLFKVLSGDPS